MSHESDRKFEYLPALARVDAITYDVQQITYFGSAGNSDDEKKTFYESLLKLPWLSSRLRGAVMRELGLSLQKRNRGIKHAVTTTLYMLIARQKELLRRGERPIGGIHEAAVAIIADEQSMSVEALKKRIQRARITPHDRRRMSAHARSAIRGK